MVDIIIIPLIKGVVDIGASDCSGMHISGQFSATCFNVYSSELVFDSRAQSVLPW